MVPEHPGNLLHRLQVGLQSSGHPVVEELSGGRHLLVLPESLKVFSQEIALDRREVELEQLSQSSSLFLGKVLGPFQEQPPPLFEHILLLGGLELPGFTSPDLVDCLVELPHDVEAVEDVQSVGGLLGNDLEIRRPHVTAHELELCAALLAELPEKAQQCFCPPLRAAPQKASGAGIELIDHGQVLLALEDGNFVDADLCDAIHASVGKTVINDELDGPKDAAPTGFEDVGRLLPGKPLCPPGEINLVGDGHLLLAIGPGQSLHPDTMARATHPAGRITEVDLERPDRHVLEKSNRLHVVRLAPLAALGACGLAVAAGLDVNDQGFVASNRHQFGVTINERLETLDLVQ